MQGTGRLTADQMCEQNKEMHISNEFGLIICKYVCCIQNLTDIMSEMRGVLLMKHVLNHLYPA
jgi:hypothetical protein